MIDLWWFKKTKQITECEFIVIILFKDTYYVIIVPACCNLFQSKLYFFVSGCGILTMCMHIYFAYLFQFCDNKTIISQCLYTFVFETNYLRTEFFPFSMRRFLYMIVAKSRSGCAGKLDHAVLRPHIEDDELTTSVAEQPINQDRYTHALHSALRRLNCKSSRIIFIAHAAWFTRRQAVRQPVC